MLVGKAINGSFWLCTVRASVFALLACVAQAQFTLDDIAQHNSNTDCWSALYGEVYDVTAYLPNHPNTQIISLCGIDGTTLFEINHAE